MITKTIKQFFWAALLSCSMAVGMTSCVDNDDDVPMTRYTAEKMTAAQFLEENESRVSDFPNKEKSNWHHARCHSP